MSSRLSLAAGSAGRRSLPAGRAGRVLPLLSAAGLAAATGALAPALPIHEVNASWLLLGAGTVALAIPIIARARRGDLRLLEPLPVFTAMQALLFVVRPAWDLAHDNLQYVGLDISRTIGTTLVVGLLGAVGFGFGYLLPLGPSLARALPRLPDEVHPDTFYTAALLVAACIAAAFGLFAISSGALNAPVDFFIGRNAVRVDAVATATKLLIVPMTGLIPLTLLLWAGPAGGARPLARLASAGAALFLILALLPAGDRQWPLGLVLGIAVFASLRLGRRPPLWVLLVGFLAALTVLTFVREVRAGLEVGEAASTAINPTSAIAAALDSPETGMAPSFSTMLLVVPDSIPHTSGMASVLEPAVRWIPRALWTEKPEPQNFRVLTELWGPGACSFTGQCNTFSPYFEPYLDFGLAGVAGFAVVFGLAWRALWEYYRQQSDALLAQALYASLLPFLLLWMRANFIDVLMQVVLVAAPVVMIALVAARGRKGLTGLQS